MEHFLPDKEGEALQRIDAASKWRAPLQGRLYYVLATALCVLAVTGIVLRGRDAVVALSWGLEDIVSPATSELKHRQQVNYGVYDYHQRFSKARGVAVEHIFVSWLSSDSSDAIRSTFAYAKERNRWPMITIEPFAVEGRGFELLDDVVAGAYDSTIASVCRSIGSLNSSVFIRWGHEMEGTDVRYPWSGANGGNYIAAYRHFAARCRAEAPEALLIWSPKGGSELAKYYPGRAFVDFVGVSLYELPAYDLDHFGKARTFREVFVAIYQRIIAFDKPVIIAEMGVSGDPNFQARWMADFFRSAQNFPLLRTVVYFNAKDSPGAWPEKYGIPDWTIDPNIFE
jgi:beta-mannanase